MLQVLQDTRLHGGNGPKISRCGIQKKYENNHSPVAAEVVVEASEAELEDVVSAPETALVVAADALEAAVLSPALATLFPPATVELAAAVVLAEAGQLAADGSFTLTLYRILVSESRFRSF